MKHSFATTDLHCPEIIFVFTHTQRVGVAIFGYSPDDIDFEPARIDLKSGSYPSSMTRFGGSGRVIFATTCSGTSSIDLTGATAPQLPLNDSKLHGYLR
jgi:hypothetical protein